MDKKVLVDTCVWIDFLSQGEVLLADLLVEGRVLLHPLIIGELVSGNLPARSETIHDLLILKRVPEASFEELMHFVDLHKLYGRGLHWNDISILAGALLGHVPLWTRDRRLKKAAKDLGCAWKGE